MRKVYLGDIAVSQTGPFGSQLHEEDYVDVGTPIVTVEHLGDFGFTTQNLPFVSDEDTKRLSKYLLKEGDIVFSRVGSIDRSVYVKSEQEGWLFSGRCLRVRANKVLVNPRFLSFYFKQKNFKKMMLDISVGATMPSLNTTLMNNLPIELPSMEVQDNVAKLLDDIDSKLELNNKIISELESMAKTIYDYWFLQFDFPDENGKPYKSSGGKMVWNEELKREIPVGWDVKELGDICSFSNGINYDKDVIGDKKYRIVNVRNVSSSTFLINKDNLDIIDLVSKQADKYIVANDSILIARSGCPGAVRLLLDNKDVIYCGFIIQCLPNNATLRYYIAYNLKQYEGSNVTKTGGSILQNVSQDTLKQILLLQPSSYIIDKFNSIICPIIDSLQLKIKENSDLASLRDFLLPMLMNGQVTFKDLK